jgi:hypothetical protein
MGGFPEAVEMLESDKPEALWFMLLVDWGAGG